MFENTVSKLVHYIFLLSDFFLVIFFFFQAEDGIRDYDVTGVQTCALPILWHPRITNRPHCPQTPGVDLLLHRYEIAGH